MPIPRPCARCRLFVTPSFIVLHAVSGGCKYVAAKFHFRHWLCDGIIHPFWGSYRRLVQAYDRCVNRQMWVLGVYIIDCHKVIYVKKWRLKANVGVKYLPVCPKMSNFASDKITGREDIPWRWDAGLRVYKRNLGCWKNKTKGIQESAIVDIYFGRRSGNAKAQVPWLSLLICGKTASVLELGMHIFKWWMFGFHKTKQDDQDF